MKVTKIKQIEIKKIEITKWHTISLMECYTKYSTRDEVYIGYEIWETKINQTFGRLNLKPVYDKFEEMCEKALSKEKKADI